MATNNMRIVYIGDGNDYLNFIKEIIYILKKRQLLPFLGAGISRKEPSNLPLSEQLKLPLREALWNAANIATDEIRPSDLDRSKAKWTVDNAPLERLLDALHQTHGNNVFEYLSILNSKKWNSNHAAIAALSYEELLPICITLNFDLLIEEALSDHKANCIIECPLTNVKFEYGKGHTRLRIIKPHGSFVPPHVSSDQYQYLSTTLSQIGSHPARSNIERISEALSTCPVLFVAGYSDNDWDIFPILTRQEKRLIKQVIWVQHAESEEVKNHPPPKENERSIQWLRSIGDKSTLLIGPVDQFLNDLINESGAKKQPLQPTESQGLVNLPNANQYVCSEYPDKNKNIATIVSLSILIQQTGTFSEELLQWLVNHPTVKDNPTLVWKVHDLLGHSRHTWGQINDAIKHTKEVIRIKKAYLGPDTIAGDLIWLGYEYLCLAKHPRPVRILAMPFSIFKGLRLLKTGVKIADNHSARLKALSRYYRADLFHGWVNAFMVFGQSGLFIAKPLLKLVDRLYDCIEAESDLMDDEYYWLRHLEIHLLSGKSIRRDKVEKKRDQIEQMLKEMEHSYRLTQNNVQLGNVAAYRGLMSFLLDKDDKAASKYLDEAEELWSEVVDNVASGRRRILVFRRFIGQVSFGKAITSFLRDAS
jgi:hypothetical protein